MKIRKSIDSLSRKSAAVALVATAALAGSLICRNESAPSGGSVRKNDNPAGRSLSVSNPLTDLSPPDDRQPMSALEREEAVRDLREAAIESPALLGRKISDASTPPGTKEILAEALVRAGTKEAMSEMLGAAVALRSIEEKRQISQAIRGLAVDGPALATATAALTAVDDPIVLSELLDAVVRLAQPETVEMLVEAFRHDASIRGKHNRITQTLAGIRNEEAARSLAKVVSTAAEPGLVEASARALSKMGSPVGVEALVGRLERVGDTDPALRSALLRNLARFDDPRSKSVLIRAPLDHPDAGLVNSASSAIARIK